MKIDIIRNSAPYADKILVEVSHVAAFNPPVMTASYEISRLEAMKMRKQLGDVLGIKRPEMGMAGEAFHERLREDEIARYRQELLKLRERLEQMAARLDVL